jgi:hypothetical protein
MTDAAAITVAADEWFARYVFHEGYIRADGTLKPDAFIPYKRVELSVSRHFGLTEAELWQFGCAVGSARNLGLRGRGDFQAQICLSQRLRVVLDPLPDNPNHANVVDWPADKQSQKEKALEIARVAQFKRFSSLD